MFADSLDIKKWLYLFWMNTKKFWVFQFKSEQILERYSQKTQNVTRLSGNRSGNGRSGSKRDGLKA
jgi:hypothetical protein